MKKFKNLAIFAAAITLGLLAGFALRRTTTKAPAGSTAGQSQLAASTNHVASAPGKGGSRGARIDDSPLATGLARDLSMSEGVTRWLYWLEAIEKAQLT